MKKEILAMLICLFLTFVYFSGCVKETSRVEEPKITGEQKTVYIDDDYDNTISGWGIDHFNVIQNGISNVTEGGTVYVYNGVYYENLVINKSITMIGEDKENTIIKSGGKDFVVNILGDNCIIQNINISSGFEAGVNLISNRSTLTNNTIYDNFDGIRIDSLSYYSLSYNVISNNIISKNKNGVKIKTASNTLITNNQISSNNLEGIILESSYNSTISDNVLKNNGITISGFLYSWNTHVIENNTANDKPIYYYKNENGITVPNDAIQIILANCSNFEIKNIDFDNITNSIQIGYCSYIEIENNYFESNIQNAIISYYSDNNTIISNTVNSTNGIDITKSDNNNILQNNIGSTSIAISTSQSNYNNISENNIFSNSEYGLFIQSNSDDNKIFRNKIHDNHIGIRLKSSKYNTLYNNEFKNNSYNGLYICCGAEKNTIYNNSFIENVIHVDYVISDVNYFYKDEIGNYWDDYIERYPDAIQIDGIWDTPYRIPRSSFEDNYPLVDPVEI
jgi:parallel beta-helix repeat protein